MASDWEFVYNGITLGGDTYPLMVIEGFAPPDSREDVSDKAIDHGAYVYAQYLQPRRITLQGFVIDNSPAAFQTKLDALVAAFYPVTAILPMVRKVPGRIQERVYCVPTKRNYNINLDFSLGYTEWAVQLIAGDPRIYDDAESTLAGSGAAVNAGNFPTEPSVTITGAANNPTITNVTTGEMLKVNVVMGAGDELLIDFAQRTIKLNGVTAYGSMDLASVWWDLEPGNNDITYAGGGAMTMRWRSAWL